MPEQGTESANPTEPTFAERMQERLAAEREPEEANSEAESDEEEVIEEEVEEASDDARNTDDVEDEEPEELTSDEDDTDEAITEETSDDAIAAATERAEKAEEARASMERDYRKKTHKIAESVRSLEDSATVVEQTSQFYANLAEQSVSQYANINWGLLKTRPQEHAEAEQAYKAALQHRDAMKRNVESISTKFKELKEEAKKRQSEVSQDILKTTVDDWSNDLYAKLRTYAVDELAYTEAEFDDMSDWRQIRDIHAQYQVAQAPKSVAKLKRLKGKPPAKKQRGKRKVRRDAKGKFQDSRKQFWENPGDKQARHNFFQDRLRAEGQGR